jgi:phosphate transport system permease protein
MGEVEFGSIHYRALFMVGIVLFLIALVVNFLSQTIAGRYKASY